MGLKWRDWKGFGEFVVARARLSHISILSHKNGNSSLIEEKIQQYRILIQILYFFRKGPQMLVIFEVKFDDYKSIHPDI